MMALLSFDNTHGPSLNINEPREFAEIVLHDKAAIPGGYEQHTLPDFGENVEALDTYDYEDFGLSDSTDDWLSIAVDMDNQSHEIIDQQPAPLKTKKRKRQTKREPKLKKAKAVRKQSIAPGRTPGNVKAEGVPKAHQTPAPSNFNGVTMVTPKTNERRNENTPSPTVLKTSKPTVKKVLPLTTQKDEKLKSKTKSGQTNDEKSRSRVKSSMYRGVSRCAKDGRWQSRIRHGSKVKYLGRFKTEYEAALCYDNAAKLFHGVRATTNF